MKKVEILRHIFDTLAEDLQIPGSFRINQNTIRKWLDDSEEGKFIEHFTKKPVEIVRFDNPDCFSTMILIYAYLDEEIETFWRLKFK